MDCWLCFSVALVVIAVVGYVIYEWVQKGQPW